MQCGVLCISPGFPGDCGVQVALPPPHALLISPPLHDKACHFSEMSLAGCFLAGMFWAGMPSVGLSCWGCAQAETEKMKQAETDCLNDTLHRRQHELIEKQPHVSDDMQCDSWGYMTLRDGVQLKQTLMLNPTTLCFSSIFWFSKLSFAQNEQQH